MHNTALTNRLFFKKISSKSMEKVPLRVIREENFWEREALLGVIKPQTLTMEKSLRLK